MKKVLFFILLSGFVFGQNFKEKFSQINTEEELKQDIAEIVADTGKPYEFSEIVENKYTVYNYVNKEDKNDVLQIFTYSYNDGENKDLEIKGVKKWTIKSMTGKFLTLFPIWKKYVNPDAEKEKIAKRGNDYTPIDRFVRLYKNINSENFWIFEL